MIAPAPEQQIALNRISIEDPFEIGPQTNSPSPLKRTITKYPVAALVAAGVVGLTLGWVVKRRLH